MTAKKPKRTRKDDIPASGDISYGVEWRPIPEKQRDLRRTRITRIVKELQKNPGKSARVARNAKSTSSVAPWRKYGCIAHVRQAEDNPELFDVYAWWPVKEQVGHAETDSTE